jgi:alpha-mannosidase
VRCVLQFVHRVRDSSITTWMTLYRDLARIDYRAVIDWQERATAEAIPNLKVSFCAELDGTQAWFETPLGATRRPAGGQEVPALRWAACAGDDYGFAVLNAGRSGHDALGSRLRLSLARSATSPDLDSGVGVHETRFALLPMPGPWDAAAVTRHAAGFNQPLLARAGAAAQLHGDADGRVRLMRPIVTGSDSVVITAVKHARDGDGRVLRLAELGGQNATASVRGLPEGAAVWDCDLTEQRVTPCTLRDGCVEVQFSPHQVRTLLVADAGT